MKDTGAVIFKALTIILAVTFFAFSSPAVGMADQPVGQVSVLRSGAQAPGVVVGTTTNSPHTLTLKMVDDKGIPVTGVTVHAMRGNFEGTEADTATTDLNGNAVFRQLRSGDYYFFADIEPIRKHSRYALSRVISYNKTCKSYYISEVNHFEMDRDVNCKQTIMPDEFIWITTFYNTFPPEAIIMKNDDMKLEQPLQAGSDFIQVFMPMGDLWSIMTVKDGDYDAWVLEFYAEERTQLNLL